jgi:hypothetical protein
MNCELDWYRTGMNCNCGLVLSSSVRFSFGFFPVHATELSNTSSCCRGFTFLMVGCCSCHPCCQCCHGLCWRCHSCHPGPVCCWCWGICCRCCLALFLCSVGVVVLSGLGHWWCVSLCHPTVVAAVLPVSRGGGWLVADGSVGGILCAYIVGRYIRGYLGLLVPPWGLLTSTNPPHIPFGQGGGHRHASCVIIVKVVDNLKTTEKTC